MADKRAGRILDLANYLQVLINQEKADNSDAVEEPFQCEDKPLGRKLTQAHYTSMGMMIGKME